MKILFIFTSKTYNDKSAWSGTMYQSFMGLKRAGFDVDYLCALENASNNFLDKLLWEYWKRIPKACGKNFRCDEAFYSKRIFTKTLKSFDYSPYDIVFVPTHIAIVNALPKTLKAKVVHLADATVDSLFDYYSEFSNLIFHNYWEAHILGKRAFCRSDLLIVSSKWCKDNAIKEYGIDPNKIKVVEFGANIDRIDIPALPKKIVEKKQLNIYWSGVNWERKGGDVALECCAELIRRGHNVVLHLTGIKSDNPLTNYLAKYPFVENHGFLNKNIKEQYVQLVDVLKNMDVFLFPSKAECSSIALCEANGFGLPCFAYNTGGTANYIINGVNGYMLPLSATAVDFANKIEECIVNKEFDHLSKAAVDYFKEHLNWEVWSERVKEAIDEL